MRFHLVPVQQLEHLLGEVLVLQVPHREVHGHGQLQPPLVPLARLTERLGEHVHRQRLDEPCVLGQRDELVRHHEPVARVVPAHQRLDPDRAPGLHVGYRLVVQDELAIVDRPAELAQERQAARAVPVALHRVELVAGVRLLRDVHRHVGPLHERRDVLPVLREERDADAGVDVQRKPVDRERVLESFEDLVGDHHGAGCVRHAGQQDRELVAAQSCDRVAVAEQRLQPGPDHLQQHVAGVVPQRVVDLLETVEVDDHHAHRFAVAPRRQDRLADPILEEPAVRQAGQRVVHRLMLLVLLLEPGRRRAVDREHGEREERHQQEAPLGRDHHGRRQREHDEHG